MKPQNGEANDFPFNDPFSPDDGLDIKEEMFDMDLDSEPSFPEALQIKTEPPKRKRGTFAPLESAYFFRKIEETFGS